MIIFGELTNALWRVDFLATLNFATLNFATLNLASWLFRELFFGELTITRLLFLKRFLFRLLYEYVNISI